METNQKIMDDIGIEMGNSDGEPGTSQQRLKT